MWIRAWKPQLWIKKRTCSLVVLLLLLRIRWLEIATNRSKFELLEQEWRVKDKLRAIRASDRSTSVSQRNESKDKNTHSNTTSNWNRNNSLELQMRRSQLQLWELLSAASWANADWLGPSIQVSASSCLETFYFGCHGLLVVAVIVIVVVEKLGSSLVPTWRETSSLHGTRNWGELEKAKAAKVVPSFISHLVWHAVHRWSEWVESWFSSVPRLPPNLSAVAK